MVEEGGERGDGGRGGGGSVVVLWFVEDGLGGRRAREAEGERELIRH